MILIHGISTPNPTAGFSFAATAILSNSSTATSQIESVLQTMLYENKAVYIGIPSSMAGVVVALPAAGSAGAGSSNGYSAGAGEVNAATAGKF